MTGHSSAQVTAALVPQWDAAVGGVRMQPSTVNLLPLVPTPLTATSITDALNSAPSGDTCVTAACAALRALLLAAAPQEGVTPPAFPPAESARALAAAVSAFRSTGLFQAKLRARADTEQAAGQQHALRHTPSTSAGPAVPVAPVPVAPVASSPLPRRVGAGQAGAATQSRTGLQTLGVNNVRGEAVALLGSVGAVPAQGNGCAAMECDAAGPSDTHTAVAQSAPPVACAAQDASGQAAFAPSDDAVNGATVPQDTAREAHGDGCTGPLRGSLSAAATMPGTSASAVPALDQESRTWDNPLFA